MATTTPPIVIDPESKLGRALGEEPGPVIVQRGGENGDSGHGAEPFFVSAFLQQRWRFFASLSR